MKAEISKKSYYLPKILIDLFKEWCKPGRDYSPKIAGAILYYMSIEPNIRNDCEKIAYSDADNIKKAIDKLSRKPKPKPMEENRIEQLKALFDEFVRISELPATPEAKISAKKSVKKIAGR